MRAKLNEYTKTFFDYVDEAGAEERKIAVEYFPRKRFT